MGKNVHISSGSAAYGHVLIDTPNKSTVTLGREDAYELVFIISGIGVYTEGSLEYRLTRGSIVFLPPSLKRTIAISDSSSFEMYSVFFTRRDLISEAEHILDSLLSSLEESEGAVTSSYNPDRLISVFERFECAEGMPRDERSVYFKMLISEAVIFLSVADSGGEIPGEKDLGARVARYISENIDRPISLDYLAQRFFVSKYYLCRAFKKSNGVSVHSYINQKRVILAKQLIESGESASGAAYKVGFGDYSSFYRAYVKVFGKSPTLDFQEGGERA